MKNSSSQISDEERQEILAVIRGEVAIPVYATDEGVKRYEIWNCTEHQKSYQQVGCSSVLAGGQ